MAWGVKELKLQENKVHARSLAWNDNNETITSHNLYPYVNEHERLVEGNLFILYLFLP
jgi:hypothetical protein